MAAGQAGAIRAGRAFVELFATNDQLAKGLAASTGMLKQWGARLNELGEKAIFLGGMILAPFVALTHQFMQLGKEGKLAGENLATYKQLVAVFDSLRKALQRFAAAIASALAPLMADLADILIPIIDGVARWVRENKELVGWIIKFGAALVAVGTAMKVAGSALILISAALQFLLTPIGLVIVALGALAAAWLFLTEGGANVRKTFGEALDGIINAIKGGKFELAWKIALKGMQVAWLEFANSIGLNTFIHDFEIGIMALRRAWHGFMRDLFGSAALLADIFSQFTFGVQKLALETTRDLAAVEMNKQIAKMQELDKAINEASLKGPGDMGLAQAKKDLAKLLEEANRPRLLNLPPKPIPEGESQGTFNAFAAARGVGVTGHLQRMIDLLQQIRDGVEEGGVVVGP